MITAVTENPSGRRFIILGLTRENVKRLTEGQPILVRAESHAGFPSELVVSIFFGETERQLTDQIQPFVSEATKVVTVPRGDTKTPS